MLVKAFDGEVEPDYAQFYLKTESGEHASDRVSGWGYEAHLEATGPGFIYVGTLKRFFTTPVRIEIHDGEPPAAEPTWQHVAEVSFVGDGMLHVLNWPGDVTFSVPTPDGSLRLRGMWGGLEEGLIEGLPEGRPSNEHLQFQIWSAAPAPRAILRWWPEWDLPPPSSLAPDGRHQIEGQDEVMSFITGRLRPVPVGFGRGTHRVLLPGGSGHLYLIWGDPNDGSWWVDGKDVRRTLRSATADEVRDLMGQAQPAPPGMFDWDQKLDPRWTAMLKSLGLRDR